MGETQHVSSEERKYFTCRKKGYPNRKVAKKFMKLLNRNARNKGICKMTSAYHCEQCDCYHLTSQPKELRFHYKKG